MSKYQVRDVVETDFQTISKFIENIFDEFISNEYTDEGIENFKKFIHTDNLANEYRAGELKFKACYDGVKLIGVIAVRGINHITLMFVDKDYHKQGIGKQLVDTIIIFCAMNDSEKITVNSSPYALNFYKKLGFKEAGEKTTNDGITYIPLEMPLIRCDKCSSKNSNN